MCRLRTYLSLSAVKTSQNLPNNGATPTLRNGRGQLLSGHLDCFNGPRPAATSHKRPRKQRKVGLWNCLRAVRSDSPVLEGRPTVLHNIDQSNIFGTQCQIWKRFIRLANIQANSWGQTNAYVRHKSSPAFVQITQPDRRHDIIGTKAGILSMATLEKSREIGMKYKLSCKKMNLQMPYTKWRRFYGPNVLEIYFNL